MKVAVVAVLIGVYGSMLYLVVMNRASEKVAGAAVSASFAALIGVLLAVFVFGGEPPVRDRFPVSFIAFQDDQTPAQILFRKFLDSYFLIAESQKINPNPEKGALSGKGMYHEFLQKAAIDSLAFRFQEGWNIDSVRFKTSMPMSAPHPLPGKDVLKLTTAQLEESLRDNRFAKLHVIEPELCLPPKLSCLSRLVDATTRA